MPGVARGISSNRFSVLRTSSQIFFLFHLFPYLSSSFGFLIQVLLLASLNRPLMLVPFLGSLFWFLVQVPDSGSSFEFLILVLYLGSLTGFLTWVPYLGSLLRFLNWFPYMGFLFLRIPKGSLGFLRVP